MREAENALQQFAEYVLKHSLARQTAAPYIARWVRQFLARGAAAEPLADQVRRFCDDLECTGHYEEWQLRQAEHALRLYFVNFLGRTYWHRQPPSAIVDEQGGTDPIAALEQLRLRIRSRHYSYRTEASYADWARRFLEYVAERQTAPRPRVDSEAVRNLLAHLAVHRQVSASTQNQALAAVVFLCREVLGTEVEGLSSTVRAKGGGRLPVVLSVPETAALLEAMRGTARLMASLIYGGGLRVSECCELRIKDIDLEQGLVTVRAGKGAKDWTTLLPDCCRAEPEAQLSRCRALHDTDRTALRSPLDRLLEQRRAPAS